MFITRTNMWSLFPVEVTSSLIQRTKSAPMCKFNKALILCLLLLLISFQERSEPPTRANKNAKELGVGEDTGRESIAEYLKCLKKKKTKIPTVLFYQWILTSQMLGWKPASSGRQRKHPADVSTQLTFHRKKPKKITCSADSPGGKGQNPKPKAF